MKTDASHKHEACVQAYLLVWLYVGVHNLAGLRGTAQRQQIPVSRAVLTHVPASVAGSGGRAGGAGNAVGDPGRR